MLFRLACNSIVIGLGFAHRLPENQTTSPVPPMTVLTNGAKSWPVRSRREVTQTLRLTYCPVAADANMEAFHQELQDPLQDLLQTTFQELLQGVLQRVLQDDLACMLIMTFQDG